MAVPGPDRLFSAAHEAAPADRGALPTVFGDVMRSLERLPGQHVLCSLDAGWSSLLLRRYSEPAHAGAFETAPIPCQTLVLVKSGGTAIESFSDGYWRKTAYVPGDLGMTPPGETARLRWRGHERHETLQLFLPTPFLDRAAAELRPMKPVLRLNSLSRREPWASTAILAIEQGLMAGYPAIYAESAAHFLALHLLCSSPGRDDGPSSDEVQMRRAEDYMRARLAEPITLADIAAAIGCSSFQLIRLTKRIRGQTPMRLLATVRMEAAERLVREGRLSARQIALDCGYTNPSHFATAFRRQFGVSPRQFRSRA
ncbi:helix-turn-helix domain-containing protein [Belnapia sp. F-4-1]|uniref:helix-turn-helix domain-containing protein n=1 Tax=Belnapia sp. F-4-1 TaxID=1545443 RepID=UPI00068A7F4A|nr:AraC family transcriptional regulator [Belnapia sp. F-4-1]